MSGLSLQIYYYPHSTLPGLLWTCLDFPHPPQSTSALKPSCWALQSSHSTINEASRGLPSSLSLLSAPCPNSGTGCALKTLASVGCFVLRDFHFQGIFHPSPCKSPSSFEVHAFKLEGPNPSLVLSSNNP